MGDRLAGDARNCDFLFSAIYAIMFYMKAIGISVIILVLLAVGLRTIDIVQRVIDLAVSTNNTDVCSVVPRINWLSPKYPTYQPSRYECYRSVALANKNFRACDLEVRRNDCYTEIAKKYHDIAVCAQIEDNSATSSASRGACYGSFMKDLDDIRVCEALNGQSTRSACFFYYVKQVSPDLQICDKKIENGLVRYKDFCYKIIARARQNVQLCERIIWLTEREDCIREIGAQSTEGSGKP